MDFVVDAKKTKLPNFFDLCTGMSAPWLDAWKSNGGNINAVDEVAMTCVVLYTASLLTPYMCY